MSLHPELERWLKERGWTPWPFQRETWDAYAAGRSGLIQVPTGAGKTYAAYLGPLSELLRDPGKGLRILYLTPLRSVSRDVEKALKRPLADIGAVLRVESRTGDTPSHLRAKQRRQLPEVLITTPESLSLLLSYDDARAAFAGLRAVICDEWHELLPTKRGTQTELALTRLRALAPKMRTWAMSATIGNPEEALQSLLGTGRESSNGILVRHDIPRPVHVEALLPDEVDAFPWSGNLGLAMRKRLVEWLNPAFPTLIFVNTRSQAERWYQEFIEAKPEWLTLMSVHHGSIDKESREKVEGGIKDGSLRFVVATSSLDLGVDFPPVERVVQIGSPKGVSRLVQRAGRAAHRPGEACGITIVPTNALELLEVEAVRRGVEEKRHEERIPLRKPYDVLAQHVVTCALGGGMTPDALYDEVRNSVAYKDLSRAEFDWVLALVERGGSMLGAYPQYHKVTRDPAGCLTVADERIAKLHRLNIGTISSDSTVSIQFLKGSRIGNIEENYVARMNPGDTFVFAGRVLEFIRMHESTVYVRPGSGRTTQTPRWSGARFALTAALGAEVRKALATPPAQRKKSAELARLAPVFAAQEMLSVIPQPDELLAETLRTREGWHLCVYPFEGQQVHEALALLLALRLSRAHRATFSLSTNDYGFELLCGEEFPYADYLGAHSFSPERLLEDTLEAMNLGELAKRQFRDIARVSGLVFQNYPGLRKQGRQVQSSSGLLYDIFRRFDPENLLLSQADREVLENQFEQSRLIAALDRISQAKLTLKAIKRPTPLAFPLVVSRIAAQLSNESLLERIERMKKAWFKDDEKEARETEMRS